MTYDPIIAFCKQRLNDLGATTIVNPANPWPPAAASRSGIADSDKRAIAELQLVITLCEGLNRIPPLLRQHEDKHS